MPKVSTIPATLKPYLFHGVSVDWNDDSDQAVGDCPFCGKDSKWYASVKTGQWDCKVCGASGNAITFLRQLWELGDKSTGNDDYDELAVDRRLLFPETLMAWGAIRSPIDNFWLLPGYNSDGKIVQLYRYARIPGTGRMALLATAELGHGLFMLTDGLKHLNLAKTVYVCEGPWDGMALYELLRSVKKTDDGLVQTGSEASSLYSTSAMVAVPGANVFNESWSKLLAGKLVVLMYDNDHPRKHPRTRLPVEGAGLSGMKRAVKVLSGCEQKPKEVCYLKWGNVGGGCSLDLPNGFDVRDALSADGKVMVTRISALSRLLGKVVSVSAEWVPGRSNGNGSKRNGSVEMDCLSCTDWPMLTNAWRKAMKWTEGLDRALSVMLSSILSTKALGDPLWVKIIGPASCGKSTLCEALSIAKKYVFANSTMRGFHSGFKTDRHGDEDNSLIPKIKDKTLITKDGDTLLSSPNLPQILSEGRDLYDCTARVHYRHGLSRNYDDVRMTWLLCGTESLRYLDSSELGERFLDCVVMEGIDEDLEREVNRRVIHRAIRNVAIQADGTAETRQDEDMTLAKQLTGGYVNYLRGNAAELLSSVQMPDDFADRCVNLGTFVSYMRARPSKKQDESSGREFSSRLVSQLGRLAMCLTAVLGKKAVDDEVMERVTRVAIDTARGRTLELIKELYKAGATGAYVTALAVWTGETEDKERIRLRFLKQIGAVEIFTPKITAGVKGRPKWRLTQRIRELYREVFGDA